MKRWEYLYEIVNFILFAQNFLRIKKRKKHNK